MIFFRGLIEGRNTAKSRSGSGGEFDVSTSLVNSLNVDVLLESMQNHFSRSVAYDDRLQKA